MMPRRLARYMQAAMAGLRDPAKGWGLWVSRQVRDDGWAESLNFVGPRVRTGVVGWAMLALGLMVCLHAADVTSQAQDELQDALSTLHRLEHGARQEDVRAQAEVKHETVRGAEPPELKAEGWQHAAELAQGLSYDWLRTLDRVDAASLKEHAVLMQLHLDLSTLGSAQDAKPELHLEAAVLDDDAALQWVQALGPDAMLVMRDGLSSSFSSTPGLYAQRAEVVTSGVQP